MKNNVFEETKSVVSLPEKILQFGHSSLFRKFHNLGINLGSEVLNGRAVLVSNSRTDSREHLLDNDNTISRVLAVKEQWQDVLACATNPELKVIIINNKLVRKDVLKDNIKGTPPFSIVGKLLALLFKRYEHFDGHTDKGWIILSMNEDHHSPEILESIVLELAHLNNLEPLFLDWIENANRFYGRYV